MNQDTDPAVFHLSSTALQEYPTCSCPPRGDLQQLDDEKPLGLPLQLPLFLDFPKPKKKGIDRVFGRLSCMEFPGKGYVEDYLRYQYRRGFKFSTLRGTLAACELFLSFLGDDGKASLEQITRQNIEAFVEHELGRDLTITTVQTRLTAVYAFLRFLHERGIVEAELLVRKIRLRLPDPLPKAINPDDVKRLLSGRTKDRDLGSRKESCGPGGMHQRRRGMGLGCLAQEARSEQGAFVLWSRP